MRIRRPARPKRVQAMAVAEAAITCAAVEAVDNATTSASATASSPTHRRRRRGAPSALPARRTPLDAAKAMPSPEVVEGAARGGWRRRTSRRTGGRSGAAGVRRKRPSGGCRGDGCMSRRWLHEQASVAAEQATQAGVRCSDSSVASLCVRGWSQRSM